MLHPTLLTAAVNLVLRVLRRDPLSERLSGAAVARATGLSVLTYALYGVHLFVLAGALHETWELNAGIVLLLCIGSMGLATTAGLVAFILPSGIGARELVIVGGLATVRAGARARRRLAAAVHRRGARVRRCRHGRGPALPPPVAAGLTALGQTRAVVAR
jgi:hypothetical protein